MLGPFYRLFNQKLEKPIIKLLISFPPFYVLMTVIEMGQSDHINYFRFFCIKILMHTGPNIAYLYNYRSQVKVVLGE